MFALMTALFVCAPVAGPEYVEDRFVVADGFRVYKAASRDLCGASLDITFDGEGRLLVGDGRQVRRLLDDNGDGVYDRFEVIAKGLGGRGPQGLLVYGDRLFAVGGDGIQLFDGYRQGGELRHVGRIGASFNTGGDHAAHTVLRGHDGYVYFITGDGGGASGRRHITQPRSPCRIERACSVFRISPDGKEWECVGSGGRNSPNVGINYLGDLFSFDSDMEWHVDLPWWRPVRIHHWLQGGDQGWQSVGAYPSYYIDCLPGVVDVGRGSPDWGVFYEHDGLPAKYRDAYLVCDYMSKSATTGGYNSSGQLYAFFLERGGVAGAGAGWKGSFEILMKPRPGAKDASGRRISFGLVDIAVAPDGSFFLSDHNQGIWRVFWDPDGSRSARGAPPVVPDTPALAGGPDVLVNRLLDVPQPAAEWSRLRQEAIRSKLKGRGDELLRSVALDPGGKPRRRLRAIRLLAPGFDGLSPSFLVALAADARWEIRAQAAWLLGLRGGQEDAKLLVEKLLDDSDAFVRRRTLEALTRSDVPDSATGALVRCLDRGERLERYAAMMALSHRPVEDVVEKGLAAGTVVTTLRTLVAAHIGEGTISDPLLHEAVDGLLQDLGSDAAVENRLDFLRVLSIYRKPIGTKDSLDSRVRRYLLDGFPDEHADVRREHARLMLEYGVGKGFGKILTALESEENPVEQFHLARCLSKLGSGWTREQEESAVHWFLATQRGWFAEHGGKGRQFPSFWATVINDFVRHHRDAVFLRLSAVDFGTPLGRAALQSITDSEKAADTLIGVYRSVDDQRARLRILPMFRRVRDARIAALLREEHVRQTDRSARDSILRALAAQAPDPANVSVLLCGIDSPTVEAARETVMALVRHELPLDEALARRALSRARGQRPLYPAVEKLLAATSGASPPGYKPDRDVRKAPSEKDWRAGLAFWEAWYAKRFGRAFEPLDSALVVEKEDAEVRAFLLGDKAKGGDPGKGRKVYEKARCAGCHGGVAKDAEATIFGPELAGVTQRLKREELVDALVEPSKLVADRFKAKVVQTRGGIPLTGFITDESDDAVTLVDPERVHRIPREDILFLAAQETSLMPGRLLARLEWDEIRDLMAFLEQIGAAPSAKKKSTEGK